VCQSNYPQFRVRLLFPFRCVKFTILPRSRVKVAIPSSGSGYSSPVMGQNRITVSYKTRQLLLSKRWDAVFYTDRRVPTETVKWTLHIYFIHFGFTCIGLQANGSRLLAQFLGSTRRNRVCRSTKSLLINIKCVDTLCRL
jgi:hypothetical protein